MPFRWKHITVNMFMTPPSISYSQNLRGTQVMPFQSFRKHALKCLFNKQYNGNSWLRGYLWNHSCTSPSAETATKVQWSSSGFKPAGYSHRSVNNGSVRVFIILDCKDLRKPKLWMYNTQYMRMGGREWSARIDLLLILFNYKTMKFRFAIALRNPILKLIGLPSRSMQLPKDYHWRIRSEHLKCELFLSPLLCMTLGHFHQYECQTSRNNAGKLLCFWNTLSSAR
jgi:hypothetical protein